MAREKEDYRANIEQLNRLFPDREMLTITEVMQITGFKSRDAVKRNIDGFVSKKLSKARLARWMCG